MMVRRILAVATAVATGLMTLSCGSAGTATAPIKIGAIFSVTGPAAFLGDPEAKTARMLVEQINAAGGIRGRQLQLIIKDSQGNPERAISFTKQLIEEDEVLAIIGPSTSGETMAIKNICEEEQTILISCAAAENIVNPVARYVFKTPQKDSDAALMIFQTMKQMGIKRVGVVSGNDGFGAAGKAQIERLAPQNGIEVLISEVYDKAATDLTDVLTKLKARKVQAVINWSIVPAQSIVAKNMRQIALNIPLFQSHGFGNIKYVREAGEAGEGIIFPAGRLLVAERLPDTHPQKALLTTYKNDYESTYGEEVSTFGGHAYDAILILKAAIEKAESVETDAVRDAIEGLRGLVGTAGIFNFSAEDHNGIDINGFEMLTVRNGSFDLYAAK